MQVEATVTTRVYGLILTYPGITTREINTTLRETCGIDSIAAVNSAIINLKKKGCIVAIAGASARSTMYYQGNVMPVLRSPDGVHRKDVTKVFGLAQKRDNAMKQYAEISAELAVLMQRIKDLA